MTQIDEYERRLSLAFDRIAYLADRISGQAAAATAQTSAPAATAPVETAPADDGELVKLRAELADERLANAQLEERVKAIRQKQDTQVSVLDTQVREQQAAMSALEIQLEQLRQANAQLAASNAALREANAAGVGDAVLVNDGLQAELASLKADRAAERAEVDGVLAVLTPLLAEAATDETSSQEETV